MSRFIDLLGQLGVRVDAELLELALTHRSFAYENGGIPTNERLEFLGDAVLGVIVTDYLYKTFPDHSEGRLAKLRAAVVNANSLADVARELEVGPMVRLGRGEVLSGGVDKTSILADTMESLIGAIYLTGDMPAADTFVRHLFVPLVHQAEDLGAGLDWKTSLQEICARRGLKMPVYAVVESGPDHDKRFTARAVVDGHTFDEGRGRNKKQAEQQAAQYAFTWLQEHEPTPEEDAVAAQVPDTESASVSVTDGAGASRSAHRR